jgi:hypothetical protein
MHMNMTGGNGIFTVPAQHLPGLIALMATALLLVAGAGVLRWRAQAGSVGARRLQSLPFPAKAAVVALTFGATVHAAIIPTHWAEDRAVAILFILDTLGFAFAAAWTVLQRRHWQLLSAAMLGGTVAGYAFYLGRGWETADPVGMVVSLIELAGFFVVVLAGHTAFAAPAPRYRLAASSYGAAAALIAGIVLATSAVAASDPVASGTPAGQARSGMGAMGMSGSSDKQVAAGSSMAGMGSAARQSSTAMSKMTAAGSTSPAMSSMATSGSATDSNSPAMPGMADSTPTSRGMPTMPSSGAMPPMTSSPTTGSPGTGMPGMGGGGSATALSLRTTSPAGNITWPLPMGNMGDGMQMVTPNCTTQPNFAQQRAAVSLVNRTVTALAPFESLAAAVAAGYIPITPSGAPVVHYLNPAYLVSPQTLDPGAIESLVYANTPHGAILVAAMYVMPDNAVGQMPPMPGGCLTEWHIHTNLCFSDATGVVVGIEHNGTCRPGSENHVTQPMIHVWLAPIPGGPLAVDASDAQVVAAAERLPVPSPPNGTA